MPTRPAVVPFLRFFNSVVEALCYFIKSYENWQLTPPVFLVPDFRINFKHRSEINCWFINRHWTHATRYLKIDHIFWPLPFP